MKYSKAIVRRPGWNFAGGITTATLGQPDYKKALEQHQAYCDALKACGVEVTVLEADERYPDGCFVEDTAVVTAEAAIITRPGALSRQGEEETVAKVLSQYMRLERIAAPGTLDGGDILREENHFYIGLSDRTNREGARQLAHILSGYGYTSSEVEVRAGLHLKSDIGYIGNGNFVATEEYSRLAKSGSSIVPAEHERYAANTLCINGTVLLARGFPGVCREVARLGYEIIELDTSEFRKMDGALTCLSLLF